MITAGKTQREIAEHFGLENKYAVKQLLARERRKERKIAAGIPPRPKPRKDAAPGDIVAEQAYEINRLIEQAAAGFSAIDRYLYLLLQPSAYPVKNWSGAAYAVPLRLKLHIFLPQGLFCTVRAIWTCSL